MIKLVICSLALMFVFEGILPLVNPSWFRKLMLLVSAQEDQTLRITGVVMIATGLLLAFMV